MIDDDCWSNNEWNFITNYSFFFLYNTFNWKEFEDNENLEYKWQVESFITFYNKIEKQARVKYIFFHFITNNNCSYDIFNTRWRELRIQITSEIFFIIFYYFKRVGNNWKIIEK